jgi:hypothetical protein
MRLRYLVLPLESHEVVYSGLGRAALRTKLSQMLAWQRLIVALHITEYWDVKWGTIVLPVLYQNVQL